MSWTDTPGTPAGAASGDGAIVGRNQPKRGGLSLFSNFSPLMLFGAGCVCGGLAAAAGLYLLRIRKTKLIMSDMLVDIGKKSELILKYENNLNQNATTIGSLTTDLKVMEARCRFLVDSENEMRSAIRTIPNQLLEYNNKLFEDLRQYQTEVNNNSARLTNALSSPNVRGMWGEMQLKRTVELIGMHKFCDFEVQPVLADGSRPDMVIKLINRRCIAVDSKVPLTSFQNAIACADPVKKDELLRSHAQAVRTHIKALSGKQYSRGLQNFESPTFVVLFLPSETLYSVALEYDPGLLDYAAGSNVCIASPTTLMALLKLVDAGWQRDEVNANSAEIAQLGKDMYTRIGTLVDHLGSAGKALDKALGHYNDTVRTLESRVLVSVRKLSKFGAHKAIGCLPELPSRSRSIDDRVVDDMRLSARDVKDTLQGRSPE